MKFEHRTLKGRARTTIKNGAYVIQECFGEAFLSGVKSGTWKCREVERKRNKEDAMCFILIQFEGE